MINCYRGRSGQTINLRKSSISFSKNVQQAGIDMPTELIGIEHAEQPGIYLGLLLSLPVPSDKLSLV